jgi:hypothetical protein
VSKRLLFAVCLGALAAVTAHAATARRAVALVLTDGKPETRAAAIDGVSRLDGRVIHAWDDFLIVDLPAGSELLAFRLAGVREVELTAGSDRLGRRGYRSPALAAWNAIASGPKASVRSSAALVPLSGDALWPPAGDLDAVRGASRFSRTAVGGVSADTAGPRGPYGATDLNTSEFLAGSVSVNVVLPESDGTIDLQTENWSSDREAKVISQIAAGLEWVRQKEPPARLSFVYHLYPGRTDTRARTSYEPIRRAADPSGTTGEDLWVKQILGKLGYSSGDRFTRVRAFDADTRAKDGTDWAITVFVADSLNDVDGKFADGRFAYTWIGGPYTVMTYDDQAWGIDRMDMVMRHEILHDFWAFDEYVTSSCTCTEHRGYLDGADSNCDACNPAALACVMISNGDALCDATRRQIGWADLDGDGVIDVVGEDPDTFLDPLPQQICGTPALTGLATVVAATNRNPILLTPRSSISVNVLTGVEVRADGSKWLPADPEDGAWGSPQERFRASLPDLPPGGHRLEARAWDDHDNFDMSAGAADVTIAPTASPVGNSLRASRISSTAVQVGWAASAGAVSYRVYRSGAPAGPWTLLGATPASTWTDETAGVGYYQVRAVDACGAEQPL